jgi:hypothetical protein
MKDLILLLCSAFFTFSYNSGGKSSTTTHGNPSGPVEQKDAEDYVEPIEAGRLKVELLVTSLFDYFIPAAHSSDDTCSSTFTMGNQAQCAKLYVIQQGEESFKCAILLGP